MIPYLIAPTNSGLVKNKKPWLIQDQAWQTLENAYAWRDRIKKREGLHLLGRLKRNLQFSFNTDNSFYNHIVNLFSGVVIGENPTIVPGTLVFNVDSGYATFTDLGNGKFAVTGTGVSSLSYVNYETGEVFLQFTGAPGVRPVATTLQYYPGLPVMGIWQREISSFNDEETIFFDTKYAYKFVDPTGFEEFLPLSLKTWAGSDFDFFWATNYRGTLASDRLFFVTNFVNDAADPIRYTDGATWTDFAPYVSRATPPDPAVDIKLYQAKILLPYYGRLIALNVYEGTEAGGYAGAIQFPNRCRFSQLGNPIQTDAWRSDLFGKGGFIDAPVAQDIVYATFFKNTLIVGFERSTWQLRYVGEYGLPFIWERISSDFGGTNPFSSVLFDQGIFTVGNRAILSSDAVSVNRIDLDIPDQVFQISNSDSGRERVQGIRDFKKEVVYWNYPEMQRSSDSLVYKYPNKVIVYNYRNNTYAIFRDNVTAFGIFQPATNVVTWDRTDILWSSDDVTWDDIDANPKNEIISSGNQQGFVHYYAYTTPDQESLYITNIDLSGPIVLTIPSHNLKENEFIQLKNLQFLDATTTQPITTDLEGEIFSVALVVDANTIQIQQWDSSTGQFILDFSFTPVAGSIFIEGDVILLPRMDLVSKDFNPFADKGLQMKLSHIDFLTDSTVSGIVNINLFLDTSTVEGNLIVGNSQVETYPTTYFNPFSQYAWHRFFATTVGQFVTVQITYDNELMSNPDTHGEDFVLSAMNLYVRSGGKIIF